MCAFAVFFFFCWVEFLCRNQNVWGAETCRYNIILSGHRAASPGSNFRLSTTQFSRDNHSVSILCVFLFPSFFFLIAELFQCQKENTVCGFPQVLCDFMVLLHHCGYTQQVTWSDAEPGERLMWCMRLRCVCVCVHRWVFSCVCRHLEACTRPWRSALPASVFWRAWARPPSAPRVEPARPARPQCGRLTESEIEEVGEEIFLAEVTDLLNLCVSVWIWLDLIGFEVSCDHCEAARYRFIKCNITGNEQQQLNISPVRSKWQWLVVTSPSGISAQINSTFLLWNVWVSIYLSILSFWFCVFLPGLMCSPCCTENNRDWFNIEHSCKLQESFLLSSLSLSGYQAAGWSLVGDSVFYFSFYSLKHINSRSASPASAVGDLSILVNWH